MMLKLYKQHKKPIIGLGIIAFILIVVLGSLYFFKVKGIAFLYKWNHSYKPNAELKLSPEQLSFQKQLAEAALQRTHTNVTYDPKYLVIDYPNGDVPGDTGVCSDVVIRSLRVLGIDLQKEVHEDMAADFNLYPNIWGLDGPDTNIDHRRVPNLMTFFSRHGQMLEISKDPNDYYAGDIVSWNLGSGVTHIGIVSDQLSRDGKRPMIVHNIGSGPKLEDRLFNWQITGHFRYFNTNQI